MGVWGLYPQRDPWGIAPWRESGGKALWKLALCENEINIVPQVDGTRGVDPFWTLGGMIGWRVSANCALARTGGVSEGGCAPLRSWKIFEFWKLNGAIRWILLGANLEQAMGKKHTVLWAWPTKILHFGRNFW